MNWFELIAAAPPGRDEVRRVTDEVFSRREFDESPGWLERFLNWLSGRFPKGGASGSGAFNAAGNLLFYVLLVFLLAVIGFIVWQVARNWVRRPKIDDDEIEVDEGEPERSTKEWKLEAERLEAAGEWREALRCRYRELIGRLIDRSALPPIPGRTTLELRGDLHRTSPAADRAFDGASQLFEMAWYADLPTGPEENRRFVALAAEVLAAPVDAHPDQAELVAP